MYAVIPIMEVEEGYTISDNTLSLIWDTMIAEDKAWIVFYNGGVENTGEFITYMRRKDIYPIVAYDTDQKKYTGIAWINNLNEGSAQAHFCTFNNGDPIEMGMEAINYWQQFPRELISVIVGIVPETNGPAVEFVKKIGFTEIGTIPGYCNTVYKDNRTGGVVLYHTLGGK